MGVRKTTRQRKVGGRDGFGMQFCMTCGWQPVSDFDGIGSWCRVHAAINARAAGRRVVLVGERDPETDAEVDRRLAQNREAARA